MNKFLYTTTLFTPLIASGIGELEGDKLTKNLDRIIPPSELMRLHGVVNHHRSLTHDIYHNMTFDEFSSRDLKVRNNFFALYWYLNDPNCQELLTDSHGFLVNYCFNVGNGYSFLIKVNKKEDLYVEIQYENEKCDGVPSAVYQMTTHKFGECVTDTGFGTATMKFEYLSDYPSFSYTGLAQYTSEEDLCASGSYNAYNWYTSGICAPWGNFNLMLSPCDSEGGATFNNYLTSDTTCSGAPISSSPYPAMYCAMYDDDYLFQQASVLKTSLCH